MDAPPTETTADATPHRRLPIPAVDLILLVGIAMALGAIQWWLRESPRPDDPISYFRYAGIISGLDGTLVEPGIGHQAYRLGVIGPIGVAQLLFGYSEAAYFALPVATLATFGAATFALARVYLGRVLAVCAVALATLLPLTLEESSHPGPDLTSATWFLVGIACVMAANRWDSLQAWRAGLAIAAGISFGIAWMSKETIVVLAPVVVVALVASRADRRFVILVLGSAVAALGMELLLLRAIHGDAFVRFERLLARQTDPGLADPDPARVAANVRAQGDLLTALGILPRQLWRTAGLPVPAMTVLLLAPIGGVWAWVRGRAREWSVIVTWVVLFWVAFSLLGTVRTSAGGFLLRITNDRYWLPIVPALAIGSLGFFSPPVVGTGTRWARAAKPIAAAMTALIVAAMAPWTARPSAGLNGAQPHFLEFRDWWSTHGDDYSALHSGFSLPVVRLFTTPPWGEPDSWPGRFRSITHPLEANAVVVLSNDAGPLHPSNPIKVTLADGARQSMAVVPLSWDVRLVSSDQRLAVFDPNGEDDVLLAERSGQASSNISVGLPAGASIARLRWAFEADGHGVVGATCHFDAGASVEAYTTSARTWWRYAQSAEGGPYTVDFFCPVPDGAELVDVELAGDPEQPDLVVESVRTEVYAQVEG